jgi:hypothetical protein
MSKFKAAKKQINVSVGESVRIIRELQEMSQLQEDKEDIAVYEDRASEPTMTYEVLLDDLKAHGKI